MRTASSPLAASPRRRSQANRAVSRLLSEPQQAIFGWWADLNPGAAGAEVATFQPGPDRFVVQYKNVPSAAGVAPSYKVSFQIVLYADGNVRLNYGQAPQQAAIGFQATSRWPRWACRPTRACSSTR